jgi:hypothetical protein
MDSLQPRTGKPWVPKSKYEMNLAEFPLAFLTTKIPKGTDALEYQDTIVGKDGKEIQRRWKIYPHPKYGFPSPSTQATLFELFQIWAQSNFDSPIIHFGSVYELIRRRGLAQDDKRTYERIRRDLNLLVGVTIEAKDAFWDNEKKAYVDQTFHLFEMVRFYRKDGTSQSQQSAPRAYIEASKTLWGSIEASGLITLKHVDPEFFRSLSPIQQRLALYLGKMLYAAMEHRRDVQQLARQLPILAKNSWHIKEEMTKACDGLLEKGFPYLTAYRYERARDGRRENIIFQRHPVRGEKKEASGGGAPQLPQKEPQNSGSGIEEARQELLVEDILSLTGDPQSRDFYALTARSLSEQTIRRALAETRAAHLQHDIRTNPGRYFTDLIKRYAAEQGTSLASRTGIPRAARPVEEPGLFTKESGGQ